MTTPSLVGSPNVLVVDCSAASGTSAAFTVPPQCNGIVAIWAHWDGGALTTLATLSLGGDSFLPALVEKEEGGGGDINADGVGIALLLNPPTGSQQLTHAWSGDARTEGGEIVLVFLQDVNTADAVRAAVVASTSEEQLISGDLTSVQTTDLVLGFAEVFGVFPGLTIGGAAPDTMLVEGNTVNTDVIEVGASSGLSGTVPITVANPFYTGVAGIALKESVGGGTITGTGAASAQAAQVAGTGTREITATGTLVSQSSTLSGSGVVGKLGTGTIQAQASVVAGTGVLLNVRTLVLTQATGRELRDESSTPVNLTGILYEWYDDPDNTDGDPTDEGTFDTDASGEATVTLTNSSLTDGAVGGLLLRHPTDPAIRGYYRVPVTLTQ